MVNFFLTTAPVSATAARFVFERNLAPC